TVKGLSEGTATITVTSKDNGMTATCIVTVIIPVTSVELDHTEITMDVGDTFVLHATVLPENAKDKSVTWSVSNKKIAYVEDGMITALSPGETTVTVTTGYKGYTATCTVKTIQHAEGVTIRNAPESIELDNSLQLIASVYPEDASNKKVTWSVDNKEVLSVRNGLITGLSLGVATVTVKTVDGGYTASCTISVNEPIVRIHIDKPTILLPDIGSTAILEATHTPQSIPVDLSWKSDRPAVVKVDNGMLTAISPGIATITVTDSLSGQRATCVVTVECLAKDLSLDRSEVELELNRSIKLNATVSPDITTDKTVKWSSDNESIAKVDQDGNVTSYGTGTVTITATTSNGLVSECTIEIFGHVTGIELDKESIVFPDLMERDALIATVIHDRAKDTSVIWTSSNEDVAIVDGKGSVTSFGKGTATITAKTTDGGYTAECEITVNAKVKTVVLNNDSLTLGIGERFQLIATVGPDYANNKNVTWSSKDQSIVTVNESGIISAESKGTTVITVTTEDGGLTAACIVTVVTRVSGITLDISDLTISDIGESYTRVPTIEPEDADNKDVIWTSDNKDIAVVDEYGTVTGMSIGTTSITVTTADGGFYATCIVTVEGKVKTITLDRSELTMESEEVAQLTAEVYPELATKNLVWFSSDDSIATVDDNGRITSFDNGNVVIICKDVYTGIYADCEITVYTHVNTVEIDEILETVYAGDSLTLTVTIGPEKAVDRTVSWQVDNEDIATIDSNGRLTVKNAGIFTVKATTNDGGYVGMLRVETFSRIASITLEEFLILYETQNLEVKYSVDPMDSPESLIWSVDNDKVVSFKDGKLTALSVGDATLTATSESGNVQAICKITVNERELFVLDAVDVDGNTVRIKHIEKDMELIKNTEWTDLRPVIPVTMTCTGTIVLKADVVRMLIDYDTIIDVTSTDYHIALKPEMVTSVNEDVILNKEYATIVIGNTATSEDAKKLLDELMDSITSKDVTPVLKLRFNDTINEFILNKEFMETISSKEVDIMVSNGIYSVTLSSDTIGILEGDVKLGMKNTPAEEMNSYQKKTIGDRYAISINLSANDVPYHSLGGKSTVSFPYTLAEGEDPSMIQIWYVDETSAHSYPATYQDGMVTFETDHFSCYVVAFEDPPKQDLNIDDGTNIILVIVALVIVLFVVATVSMALKRMKRHNRN
ncbi:MAG: Ig-like domain-containing protein, partial [archaeon]|nr:Ig-like domain-containing protein [archaeon]